MTITWALVADRSKARIFENRGPGKGLQLVEEVLHPSGRKQDREIDTDKPGRSFDRGGEGRHAMEAHELPHEHDAANFARELNEKIEHARTGNRYTQLVIAAPPDFLGLLRKGLSEPTRKMLVGVLDKHLLGQGDGDIAEHLGKVMNV